MKADEVNLQALVVVVVGGGRGRRENRLVLVLEYDRKT